MKRSVPVPFLGENVFMYFDFGRFAEVEERTGKNLFEVVLGAEQGVLPLKFLAALYLVGTQHAFHRLSMQDMYTKLDEALSSGEYTVGDLVRTAFEAVVQSGLFKAPDAEDMGETDVKNG